MISASLWFFKPESYIVLTVTLPVVVLEHLSVASKVDDFLARRALGLLGHLAFPHVAVPLYDMLGDLDCGDLASGFARNNVQFTFLL